MKKMLAVAALMFGFLSFSLFSSGTAIVSAQGASDRLFGVCNNPNDPNFKKYQDSPFCKDQANKENPVVRAINITANVLATLAGVAAVIVLLIGGFRFITAGGVRPGQRAGDPNKIAAARSQIMYALIGIVVIALAWTITRFVTDRVLK